MHNDSNTVRNLSKVSLFLNDLQNQMRSEHFDQRADRPYNRVS